MEMDSQPCIECIEPLKTFISNSSIFTVRYYDKDLPKELLDWVFILLENNMKMMYQACDWGWKPKEKLKELTGRQARFLIVHKTEQNQLLSPVAFVHFRFVKDYGRKVVYCYELQLEKEVRGCGIGSWLMQILERVSIVSQFTRVVLTVLKANVGAIGFYKKSGYDLDETNPRKSEGQPYFIYSKVPNETAAGSRSTT